MRLLKQPGEFSGQALHLVVKGFAVVRLLLNADIPPRGENVVLLCDVLRGRHGAKALLVGQRAVRKGVVGVGNPPDVRVGQLAVLARDHRAQLPRVDKQRFARLLFAFDEEPQRDRNLRGIEQLRRHGNDAVHQIRVDDILRISPSPPDCEDSEPFASTMPIRPFSAK